MSLNREKMKKIGLETKRIAEDGYYFNTKGEKVDIKNQVKNSVQSTVLYSPKDGNDLLLKMKGGKQYKTQFIVCNKTTLEGSKWLLNEGEKKVIALNFASAKHPGGGFLNGSVAQEESLARSSSLYASISLQKEMYEANLRTKSSLYTDYMIYSPDIPVFRKDEGELLDQPYLLSFITSPAVNAGVIRQQEKHITQTHIDSVMKKRIEKILAVALHNNYENIVLGAFGCGVFKNQPKMVASYFKEALTKNPKFKNQFKNVVFAVLDRSEHQLTYKAFDNAFNKMSI